MEDLLMSIPTPRRLVHALLAVLLVTAVAILAPPAFAQTPDWKDPTAILGWLRGQTMLVTFGISFLWKHVPGVKAWSNAAIPWLALMTYVIAELAGQSGVAQAGGLQAAAAAHPSLVAAITVGVVNTALGKPIWDAFLKPSLGQLLDIWLKRTPQTP